MIESKRERPCINCGCAPLHHSAEYMLCFDRIEKRWLTTQYAPDPHKQGTIPSFKPRPLNVPLVRERILVSDVSLTCEYPNLLMQRRPA